MVSIGVPSRWILRYEISGVVDSAQQDILRHSITFRDLFTFYIYTQLCYYLYQTKTDVQRSRTLRWALLKCKNIKWSMETLTCTFLRTSLQLCVLANGIVSKQQFMKAGHVYLKDIPVKCQVNASLRSLLYNRNTMRDGRQIYIWRKW